MVLNCVAVCVSACGKSVCVQVSLRPEASDPPELDLQTCGRSRSTRNKHGSSGRAAGALSS